MTFKKDYILMGIWRTWVLIYLGNIVVMKNKYRFIELRFSFKQYTITVGLLLLVVIAAIYFYANKQDASMNVLYYILEIGFLAFLLGLTIWIMPDDNTRVTLEMIICDKSGFKRLETKNDLELYQITNTDYRFKDLNNRNEYIIPTGQIQKIIYQSTKNNLNAEITGRFNIEKKSLNGSQQLGENMNFDEKQIESMDIKKIFETSLKKNDISFLDNFKDKSNLKYIQKLAEIEISKENSDSGTRLTLILAGASIFLVFSFEILNTPYLFKLYWMIAGIVIIIFGAGWRFFRGWKKEPRFDFLNDIILQVERKLP